MPASVRRANSSRSPPKVKRTRSVRRNNSFNLLARPSRPGDRLTVEVLHALTPYNDDVDEVSEAARALLLNTVKLEPHVREIFFPEEEKDEVVDEVDWRGFPLDRLATALVSQCIATEKDEYKFHQMIDSQALDIVLNEIYNSLQWKKLGFCLYALKYPDVVRDDKLGVCLRDFMEDNGHVWAEKLLSYIMEPRWTSLWMHKIVRGQSTDQDYNREMNALFVKLHLLDPQVVIPAYQFLLNQRALPAVTLELATRNYLGGALDHILLSLEVQAAIQHESIPLNVSRISLSDIEVFYGVEVDEFIVTECRNIGVWSNKRPENSRVSKAKDRCSIM
ncbi:hypothetical protein FSP39_010020 [Pinctada imbricata]|uniref:Uncharacterized protein n=1 Tax=Pinctada imbricata TaxID=66713 RepID=A0AA88XLT8_PINIB|nr:hypothetical protein FSP39_010020 [Pinctada imbricata]